MSVELILGIIGTITGVISLIVSIYFNRIAIEQTDRNLKTQLLYEDRKRTLISLQKITDETKRTDSRYKIANFLHSFEGNFIPQDVINVISDGLEKLDKFEDERAPYDTQRQRRFDESKQYETDDSMEEMSETEKFQNDFNNEFTSFKKTVKHSISKAFKKI